MSSSLRRLSFENWFPFWQTRDEATASKKTFGTTSKSRKVHRGTGAENKQSDAPQKERQGVRDAQKKRAR